MEKAVCVSFHNSSLGKDLNPLFYLISNYKQIIELDGFFGFGTSTYLEEGITLNLSQLYPTKKSCRLLLTAVIFGKQILRPTLILVVNV